MSKPKFKQNLLKTIKRKIKIFLYPFLNFLGNSYIIHFRNDNPKQFELEKYEISFDFNTHYLKNQKLIKKNYKNIWKRNSYYLIYNDVYLDTFTGAILNKKIEILKSSLKYSNIRTFTYLSKLKNVYKLDKENKGENFIFLGSLNEAYFHIWFDNLIHLYFINLISEDIKILVGPKIDVKIKELLVDLNLPFKFIFLKNRFIEVDKLYKTKIESWSKHAPIITPQISSFFKSNILNKIGTENLKFKRIFIGRRTNLNRDIKNIDAVLQSLNKYSFKTIFLEDYSIIEQAKIFNEADIICGLHGAGFTNLIFCREGTKVLELQNFVNVTTYFVISKQLNLDYFYILPVEFKMKSIVNPNKDNKKFYKQKLQNTSYSIGKLEGVLSDICAK